MDVTKKYFYTEEIPETKYYKFFSENMQLYWSDTSVWFFSCKFDAYF